MSDPHAFAAPRHILTILAVADLDPSATFYREAFGWPPRVVVPVYVEFALPDGRGLGLYAREGFAQNVGQIPTLATPEKIGPTELYFHVDDLDAAIGRLDAAGARVLSERAPRDWGDEAAYYADPDGNQVELQVDSMSPAEAEEFMAGDVFAANPIGVAFDPADIVTRRAAGESIESLVAYVPA